MERGLSDSDRRFAEGMHAAVRCVYVHVVRGLRSGVYAYAERDACTPYTAGCVHAAWAAEWMGCVRAMQGVCTQCAMCLLQ